MPIKRLNVAHNLQGILKLIGIEELAAHQKRHRAARIMDISPDAAVQILLARDIRQDFRSLRVRKLGSKNMAADLAELGVNILKRIGRIFGIGRVKIKQNIFPIGDITRLRPGA